MDSSCNATTSLLSGNNPLGKDESDTQTGIDDPAVTKVFVKKQLFKSRRSRSLDAGSNFLIASNDASSGEATLMLAQTSSSFSLSDKNTVIKFAKYC